jgi:hypothetical protein
MNELFETLRKIKPRFFTNYLALGSSKLFDSAEAPAPLKWGNFEPSLRINYIF